SFLAASRIDATLARETAARIGADQMVSGYNEAAFEKASWASGQSEPVSGAQLTQSFNGGLNSQQLMGDRNDWLGTIGPYQGTAGDQAGPTFIQDVAQRARDNSMFSMPVPVVQLVRQRPTVYDHLAESFKTTPDVIHTIANAGEDGIAFSRLENSQYYGALVAGASNPVTRNAWNIMGLASNAGHDALSAARGLYGLTDRDARSAAIANLSDTLDNLPRYTIKGMRDFSDLSTGQKTDALIKFAFDSAISAGAGRVAGVAGKLALDGGVGTLKWLGQGLAEFDGLNIGGVNYLAPLRLNAVEPGPSLQSMGGANSIGVPATRSANPLSTVLERDVHGNEIMYRTMSEKQFEQFSRTGELPPTTETSVSPSVAYSSKYDGVTVKITVAPGTSAQLQEIGIAANKPAAAQFPNMSTQTGSWMQTNARFKVEGGQMTTQLGQGRAIDIFNQNIVDFGLVPK
ncbi:hypothetical protein, partial [Pseudoduganella namucuonensis]